MVSAMKWTMPVDYAREYRNRGLPLHYYLSRNKIDIDTVKMLVEACPQTLVDVNDMSLPLIPVALSNENMKIDDLRDIIIFFLSQEQSSHMIRMRDTFMDSTPLHKVCIGRTDFRIVSTYIQCMARGYSFDG